MSIFLLSLSTFQRNKLDCLHILVTVPLRRCTRSSLHSQGHIMVLNIHSYICTTFGVTYYIVGSSHIYLWHVMLDLTSLVLTCYIMLGCHLLSRDILYYVGSSPPKLWHILLCWIITSLVVTYFVRSSHFSIMTYYVMLDCHLLNCDLL